MLFLNLSPQDSTPSRNPNQWDFLFYVTLAIIVGIMFGIALGRVLIFFAELIYESWCL